MGVLGALILYHTAPQLFLSPLTKPELDGKPSSVALASPSSSSSPAESIEIRVCTNRSCRKQGSLETLLTLSDIAPPDTIVKSCGCLGRCGAGPNLVVLPEGTFVGHCGTPSKAFDTMFRVCGDGDSKESSRLKSSTLEALSLRKRAEDEILMRKISQAEALLSQALDRKPFGGSHVIYRDRAAARLAMGSIDGALEDAREALALAPRYLEVHNAREGVAKCPNLRTDQRGFAWTGIHLPR